MRVKHEIRQNRAEHEIGNHFSHFRAEHEIGNHCSYFRAEHEIGNHCSHFHAEHEIGNHFFFIFVLNTKSGFQFNHAINNK